MNFLKGAVCQYCFDAKPFNLTACFITKCDTEFYDYVHQNGIPWIAVYNSIRALVTIFLAYNFSIDWQEEFYMR